MSATKGPDLKEVAAQNGWTFSREGYGPSSTSYSFTKGNLRVMFSRLGHGVLKVRWRGRTVYWQSSFSLQGKYFAIYNSTREAYMAALLPSITEEEAIRRVEDACRNTVETRRRDLDLAEQELTDFLKEKNK